MLITQNDITQAISQGNQALYNIVTRDFNRDRYGLTPPSGTVSNRLLMLLYLVSGWSTSQTFCSSIQVLKAIDNITKIFKDPCAADTCQGTPQPPLPPQSNPTPPAAITISWGFFTGDPGDVSTATLNKSLSINTGADYTIDTTSILEMGYFIVKEPATEPAKTRWYNTSINQGTLVPPDQIWIEAQVISGFRYYETRGAQAFNPVSGVKLSKT